SVFSNAYFTGAFVPHRDSSRVGMGRKREVKLKPILIPVIDQISARINVFYLNRLIPGHVPLPLGRIAADQVMDISGNTALWLKNRLRTCADQTHANLLL